MNEGGTQYEQHIRQCVQVLVSQIKNEMSRDTGNRFKKASFPPYEYPGLFEGRSLQVHMKTHLRVGDGIQVLQLDVMDGDNPVAEFWAEKINDTQGRYYNILHRLVHPNSTLRGKGMGTLSLRILEQTIQTFQDQYAHQKTAFALGTLEPGVVGFFKKNGYLFRTEQEEAAYEHLRTEVEQTGEREPLETQSYIGVFVEIGTADTGPKALSYLRKDNELVRGVKPGGVLALSSEQFHRTKVALRSLEKPPDVLPHLCLEKPAM